MASQAHDPTLQDLAAQLAEISQRISGLILETPTDRRRLTCRFCCAVGVRRIVRRGNPNGNAGRPFFSCRRHVCARWIAWDDAIGMSPSNPHCDCSVTSRLDRAGPGSSKPGAYSWTYAEGACNWFRWVAGSTAEMRAGSIEAIAAFEQARRRIRESHAGTQEQRAPPARPAR